MTCKGYVYIYIYIYLELVRDLELHPFLKNQVLVFNHILLEAGACFSNRGVFSYSLDRRSSEAFIVGIQVNHMWFDNRNSNC